MLQVLQSRAPGTWSLKMPSHAVHIETLLATYPDVRIVWAHRDPFKATASFLRLNYLSRAVMGADVDRGRHRGQCIALSCSAHVNRPLADPQRIGDDRFFDLHYADLMRDPIGVMRALYDWAGDDLTASTEQSMLNWLDEHPQDRHGVAPYSLDGSGVTRADLDRSSTNILSAFDIELEEDKVKAAVTTEEPWLRRRRLARSEPGTRRVGDPCRGVRRVRLRHQGPALMHPPAWSWATNWAARSSRSGSPAAAGARVPMSLCYRSFRAVACRYCAAGSVSHCAQARYIGMGPAGGFADFAVVPARHGLRLPAELPATYSALVEPFAVGLHGVHSAESARATTCSIVGAGGVGLTTIGLGAGKGRGRVTVADPDLRRREFARAMGATDVLASVADADAGATT